MNEVEQIKDRLDIVDVISNYVPLKQAGSNWKGLSPFKNEKTPSFMVSSEKGIWHDFSSGQGGDVFSFVMLMEGIEFREALEMLAKRAGVELKPRSSYSKKDVESKNSLYDALDMAMKFYHLNLPKNQKALEYIAQKRELKKDIIQRYRIGYSPDEWSKLSDYLVSKGFDTKQLLSAGLAKGKKDSSGVYDVFRNRIMFPVFDTQKRAIGFSARALDESENAKYINTPETPIYHKSSAIYGLAQAKDSIRKLDEVILVEGNMDVLALANNGYDNTVAASGTAITLEQLRILSRLTKNIKLCFDADSAGEKATSRALEIASSLDVKLMVIVLENAKDPDELIKKDKKLWEKLVANAQYAPDYIFAIANKKFDTTSAYGKKQFAAFVLPTIVSLPDEIETHHYAKLLAQSIDVPEESILNKINSTKDSKPVTVVSKPTLDDTKPTQKPKRVLSQQEKIERIILELMLANISARDALDDIEYDEISDLHTDVFKVLRTHPKYDVVRIAKLLPKLSDYVKILSLRGEQVYSDLTEHDARLEAFTQIHRLNKISKEKTKRQLTRAIAQAESNKDYATANKLLKKYQALINEE
jgi:DNA primase